MAIVLQNRDLIMVLIKLIFISFLSAVFLVSLNTKSQAHQCILEGNSAEQIMKYNSCKNDLATGTANHSGTDKEQKIIKLEQENEELRQKIKLIQSQLLSILSIAD